jgi:hypothetical protein
MRDTLSPSCRRGSARGPLFMLVQVGDEPMWAFDISMGGLKCYTRRFRTIGQLVDLSFRLPGDPAPHRVGGQITGIDDSLGEGLTLRIRFCRPSRALYFDVYRFLDRRRRSWDPTVIHHVPPKCTYTELDRPFEALLLEAFASLRLKEVHRPGFVRRGSSRDLETLGRVLARGLEDSTPRDRAA